MMDLIHTNINLNHYSALSSSHDNSHSTTEVMNKLDVQLESGSVSARTLRWGVSSDYPSTSFDLVIGADVVASIYDPMALVRTIYALSGPHTLVLISYKGRLSDPHIAFEQQLRLGFRSIEQIKPNSRNRNPDVWILKAFGKILDVALKRKPYIYIYPR